MNIQSLSRSKILKFYFSMVLAIFCVTTLSGCDLARNQLKQDRERSKEFQDARDTLAPRLPEIKEETASADSAIPSLQPYVATNGAAMKAMPLVSISVNQSVPLRDVLYELAQQADYDLELDPRITGSIIFTVRERPFDQVISRISDMAGLRYRFDDDVLRVEIDTPYNKTYKIDYLSYIRRNKGSIKNNVAVVTGDGADTGSKYEAAVESEADFWGELEQNMQQILGGSINGALKTRKTPKITATDQNPEVAATAASPATGENGEADGSVNVQPPQAVLKVESLPTDEEEEDSGRGSRRSGSTDNDNGYTFTINKQAGLVNVYASEKAQKEIIAYLALVRRAVTAQVLIEAKILEVTLNDEYATGIDWRAIDIIPGGFKAGFLTEGGSDLLNALSASTFASPTTPVGPNGFVMPETAGLMLGYAGNNLDALLQAVSGFGTVKALASPRLTVLNNQSAVLNVATNHVFFDIDIDVTTEDGVSQVDISSDINNVPEGVLVNVQPSINLDNNTVSMALRPTITRIVNEEPDPAIQFITAAAIPPITGVSSPVPELNVQELDSVIQVRSGQPIVLGGLLQDRVTTSDEGIPVLAETPIVGSLFKRHQDRIQKTELVIFLKATILASPEDSVDNTDKDLYRAFSGDRRPLDF